MKLSRDKMTDISHKLIAAAEIEGSTHEEGPERRRLEIVKAFTEILQVEEKADRASREKVRSMKRDIPEGSEEWDILQKRYYAEELKSSASIPVNETGGRDRPCRVTAFRWNPAARAATGFDGGEDDRQRRYRSFCRSFEGHLASAGVDVSAVHVSRTQPTGVAMIAVDDAGHHGRNSFTHCGCGFEDGACRTWMS